MSSPSIVDNLPHWDLSNVYAGLDGADYTEDFNRFSKLLGGLEETFDRLDIRRLPEPPDQPGSQLAADLAGVIEQLGEVSKLGETLSAFAYAYLTTDSYNAAASREVSRIEVLDNRRQQLGVRLTGWLGSLEPRLDELLAASGVLAEHAFFLQHAARQSRFLMTEELESLAADLVLDGGGAFGKLQGNVTSQLKIPFERDGKLEQLPITVVRNLSYDADPEVRERAYHAEISGWESVRTTVAACLNGVKGTAVTLARRRGRASVLDEALEQNHVDQQTLDALLGAIGEHFPTFRRYYKSKAAKLGKPQLPWWDLFAPVGEAHRVFRWNEAREFIVEKFRSFSDELGDYAATAFDQNWIDAEPRDGKRGGAFCMSVPAVEESRILANFDGSFEQVSTLAHELGHGYHNHCQQGLPPLMRGAPMTLAETASIFCETLVAEAALSEAQPAEQLAILETQIGGAAQVCLDISSRFLFESAVLKQRAQSELSPDEFCELMLAAQQETYADGIVPETYHKYMWLWKPHYYAHNYNFYNFPYAFGHLFGLGLYAIYKQQGDAFIPRYNELLRVTNQDYAAPLAARFGLDITSPEFWRASLEIVAEQVRRYESL